ncbi:unnamed protein product [Rhodiola kirilowii]
MFASRVLRGCRTLLAGSSLKPTAAPSPLNSAPAFSTMSIFSRSCLLNRHTVSQSLGSFLGVVQAPKAPHLLRFYCVKASGKEIMSRMKFNRNIRDCKRRLLVEKYELRRNLYKAFWQDLNLPSEIREKFRYKLSKLPRSSSHTRVRTRCIYTARPRAVYRKFRMSRIVFRTLAKQGELKGVQKASW